VPDDCLVGEEGDGWRLARTTLVNERVSMASGSSFGVGVEGLLKMLRDTEPSAVVLDKLGALVTEAQSLALLGVRSMMKALSGGEKGSESSVRKLIAAEHDQRVQEFGIELLGAEGATMAGDALGWGMGFLATRCLTIAGGTSEVQRNVIGERILGLPRDAG
jgi:alkylation response protein AidB-like acyl-CoA dehydrogenase